MVQRAAADVRSRGGLFGGFFSGSADNLQIMQQVHLIVATTNCLPPFGQAIAAGPARGCLLRTLGQHKSWVWALAVGEELMFSASDDKTVRVWSLDDHKCKKELSGHTDGVRSLALGQQWLFSGSRDHTVRVWRLGTWECKQVL